MPGAIDTPALLVKHLATLNPLTLHNGDQVSLTWVDADEPFDTPDPPFGTFSLRGIVPLDVTRREGFLALNPVSTQDAFMYDVNEHFYTFTEDPYLLNGVTVTGTLGGSPGHVFVEGTDYVIGSVRNRDLVPTYIQWLPTGDEPDDGTNFTADYDYPEILLSTTNRGYIDARLTIYATTLMSGEQGMTEYWPKSRLAHGIGEALFQALRDTQGTNLSGTGELTTGPVAAFGALDIDPGDSLMRYTLDLRLRRNIITQTTARRTQRIDDYSTNATL